MLVYKCDKCGKNLSDDDKDNVTEIHTRWKRYEFCETCGKPVARILKRYKLPLTYEEDKTRKR